MAEAMHLPAEGAANPRQAIAAVHAGFILNGLVVPILGPLLPLLSAKWQLSQAQAGWLFTVQSVGAMTGTAISGRLMQSPGPVRALAAGYGLVAAGLLALAFSSHRFGLLSMACVGIGLGVTVPVSNLFISDSSPLRRAAALNLLNFVWGIGAMSCAGFVKLLAHDGGLAPPLLVIVALLLALTVWLWFCPVCRRRADKAESEGPAEAAAGVWRNPFLPLTGALVFLYVGLESSVAGWSVTWGLHLDARAVLAPVSQSFFWGALLAGRLLAPLLLRRISEERLILAGLMIALSGLALLLLARSVGGLVLAVTIAGAGMAPVFPTTIALLTRCFGAAAARASAVIFVLAGLGSATLPWLVGMLATLLGSLREGLVALLVAGLLLVLCQALFIRRLRSAS